MSAAETASRSQKTDTWEDHTWRCFFIRTGIGPMRFRRTTGVWAISILGSEQGEPQRKCFRAFHATFIASCKTAASAIGTRKPEPFARQQGPAHRLLLQFDAFRLHLEPSPRLWRWRRDLAPNINVALGPNRRRAPPVAERGSPLLSTRAANGEPEPEQAHLCGSMPENRLMRAREKSPDSGRDSRVSDDGLPTH